MNGHTPGVSVLGSDEKRAEYRELRLGADDRLRICRISTFDRRKLSENAGAIRCWNRHELLIRAGVFNSRRRWQALVFLRVDAAHLVCATTLVTRFNDRRTCDHTHSRRLANNARKKRRQNDSS